MCGISGAVWTPQARPAHDDVERMSKALLHRGPDSAGSYRGDGISLAMRRLSIIDLAGGDQPLFNETRRLVLIANGEIYNHIELRQSLEARGHRFNTHSDCETILHLYEERGTDCVQDLRGMFAFALWDMDRELLLLVRDRMGEKPLYLFQNEQCLWFGSEMKTLLSSGRIPFSLEPRAINQYFHLGYVPEPATMVQGVRKLPAGHMMIVQLAKNRRELVKYWDMEDAPPIEADPVKTLEEELARVSRLIVRSDVPVGIALSGGLDSSGIAALSQRYAPKSLAAAFTIAFRDAPDADERKSARTVADALGLDFHLVEISLADMMDEFPTTIRSQDDPIADLSGSSYLAIMAEARAQGIKVMLQGHGGDELFWGYRWVRTAAKATRWKQARLRGESNALSSVGTFFLPDSSNFRQWLKEAGGLWPALAVRRAVQEFPADRLILYELEEGYRRARKQVRSFLAPALLDQLGRTSADPDDPFARPHACQNSEVGITNLIMSTYLAEVGIAQGDRLSMARSVELRLPLVDYRLVETVIGLRKVHSDLDLPPKAWWRAVLRDCLPKGILSRPKQGFPAPFRLWHKGLMARYGAMLSGGELVQRQVITEQAGRSFYNDRNPLILTARPSFLALVLEIWCREMAGICDQARALSVSPPQLYRDDRERATPAPCGDEPRPSRRPAVSPSRAARPRVWLISRLDQSVLLAEHLAARGDLIRWDSFFRVAPDSLAMRLPKVSHRAVPAVLGSIPGAHVLPELVSWIPRMMGLGWWNGLCDRMLDALAASGRLGEFDLLHAQAGYGLWASRRCRRLRRPVISDHFGVLPSICERQLAAEYAMHGLAYRDLGRFVGRRRMAEAFGADAVIVPSAFARDSMVEAGVSPKRLYVVPYDAPLAMKIFASPSRPPILANRPLKLLYVGTISYPKGCHYLLEGFAAVHMRLGPDAVELRLAGPLGPGGKQLLARRWPGVTYLGPRTPDELMDDYASAHAFVFPSLNEGSALVTYEALAAGLPVVATPDAGSLVEDGKSGLLVPPRDVPAVADAIEALYRDPVLLQRLAAGARERFDRHVQRSYGERVDEVYRDVLDRFHHEA